MKLAFIILMANLTVVTADDTHTLRTIHGSVNWRETAGKKSSKRPGYVIIQGVPTEDELQNMQADAFQAPALISEYVPEALRGKDLLKNLDLALDGWLHSTNKGRESSDRIIRIIGAAYGQECIARLNARWAIVSTDVGTDVAIVKDAAHPSDRSAFVWNFAFTSINAQIEDRKSGSIDLMYAQFKEEIADNEQ